MFEKYHERALEIGFVTVVTYLVTMFSCAVINPVRHNSLNAFSVLLGFSLRGLSFLPLCSYLEASKDNRSVYVYTELMVLLVNLVNRFEAIEFILPEACVIFAIVAFT